GRGLPVLADHAPSIHQKLRNVALHFVLFWWCGARNRAFPGCPACDANNDEHRGEGRATDGLWGQPSQGRQRRAAADQGAHRCAPPRGGPRPARARTPTPLTCLAETTILAHTIHDAVGTTPKAAADGVRVAGAPPCDASRSLLMMVVTGATGQTG